jgi:large subunit ribosomal protein L21
MTANTGIVPTAARVEIGAPLVKGATVTLKVKTHQKGDKIRVAKYKAKSRYRRVYGHRQPETTVEVVSIR